jgi:hypothetical protein
MVASDGKVAQVGARYDGGEKSRAKQTLGMERRRGDAKAREAELVGGSATAESDSFGAMQDRWNEYTKLQIDAGGCGHVGGDCPEGFEHAPFRCGAEVICGACGAVMPRGPRRFGARDAPRFWSTLGTRCDEVSSRIIRQRQVAWQVYAELQSREMKLCAAAATDVMATTCNKGRARL